ncbi:MAG: hypothetical protein AAGG50_03730 [Bacteroidota bacterium]
MSGYSQVVPARFLRAVLYDPATGEVADVAVAREGDDTAGVASFERASREWFQTRTRGRRLQYEEPTASIGVLDAGLFKTLDRWEEDATPVRMLLLGYADHVAWDEAVTLACRRTAVDGMAARSVELKFFGAGGAVTDGLNLLATTPLDLSDTEDLGSPAWGGGLARLGAWRYHETSPGASTLATIGGQAGITVAPGETVTLYADRPLPVPGQLVRFGLDVTETASLPADASAKVFLRGLGFGDDSGEQDAACDAPTASGTELAFERVRRDGQADCVARLPAATADGPLYLACHVPVYWMRCGIEITAGASPATVLVTAPLLATVTASGAALSAQDLQSGLFIASTFEGSWLDAGVLDTTYHRIEADAPASITNDGPHAGSTIDQKTITVPASAILGRVGAWGLGVRLRVDEPSEAQTPSCD